MHKFFRLAQQKTQRCAQTCRHYAISALKFKKPEFQPEQGAKRPLWMYALMFGVPAAITFYLGVWQVLLHYFVLTITILQTQRYNWKVELIETREKRMDADPIPFKQEMLYVDVFFCNFWQCQGRALVSRAGIYWHI